MLGKLVEVGRYLLRVAHGIVVQHLGDLVAREAVHQLVQLVGGEVAATRHHGVHAAAVNLLQLRLRLLGGLGRRHVDRRDDVRLGVLLARLVRAPVRVHRLLEVLGREVASKRVGEAELRGKRRAEQGRSEDNDGHARAGAGHGVHPGDEWLIVEVTT